MARRLPAELIALIHNIELTEAHWWDRALQRFVVGIVSDTGAIHPAELPHILRREYGVGIDVSSLARHVEALEQDGDLVLLPDERIKLTAATAARVADDIEKARDRERRLRERFVAKLVEAEVDVDPNEAWERLESQVLTPLVQELGARTYELLEQSTADDAAPHFMAAVGPALDSYDEREKSAIIAFLDPDDGDVRAYLFQSLNAYFFAEASGLSGTTLGQLRATQDKHHEIRVFVDTNFLFSILGLHDNPTNEVAEAADELLTDIRERVRVRLYVLPITVEETRNTLAVEIESLSGIRLSRNLAHAVVAVSEMPGLTQRYLQEAKESDMPLTPEDFFGPYERGLVAVLRERGVELFNESMDKYRRDQAVIDDALAQEEYQKDHRFRGAKSYETNLHDMVLWHFVNQKRPALVDSPLEAQYFIVTEDFGFMGFDRWKRYGAGVPICLAPATLIQLLRFWVPRSEQLDRALVASLRAPFLFPDFDVTFERVTARILRALSRYEGIEDLSVETIQAILMSEALRQRISEVPPEVEEDAILREAFVEQTRRLEERLEAVIAERDAELARGQSIARDMTQETVARDRLAAEVAAGNERIVRLESQLEEVRGAVRDRETESSRREQRWQAQQAQDRRRWFALFAALTGVVFTAGGVAAWLALEPLDWPQWLRITSASVAAICLWLLTCEQIGRRVLHLKEWRPIQAISKLRVFLLGAVGATLIGILVEAIVQGVSSGPTGPT